MSDLDLTEFVITHSLPRSNKRTAPLHIPLTNVKACRYSVKTLPLTGHRHTQLSETVPRPNLRAIHLDSPQNPIQPRYHPLRF